MILLNILDVREIGGGELSISPLKLSRSAIREELFRVYLNFSGFYSAFTLIKEERSS
jgi:hypothetical protein